MEPVFETFAVMLSELTKEKRVNWRPTADEDKFICTESDVAVEISSQHDPESYQDIITLALRDDHGRLIEKEVFSPGDELYRDMVETFGQARRKANCVDAVLAKLIKKMEGPIDLGEEDLPF